MTTNAAELGVEQRGDALWLTLQREDRRNAMSPDLLAAMGSAIDGADRQIARATAEG